MAILGIIPARYASSRFPGKPLVRIGDKSMIRRVYEQCLLSDIPEKIMVATDDERIFRHVKEFGGEVVMTSLEHKNGTSRCAEALALAEKDLKEKYEAVINIQGDEPFINPVQIDKVASLLKRPEISIATLAKKIEDQEELFNPNTVKLVIDKNHRALYFSRQAIPFQREAVEGQWSLRSEYYKHIGIYGYTKDVLHRITRLPEGKLERAERLEQLRWLENGFSVYVDFTEFDSVSVDTPDDLSKFTNNLW